MKKIILLLTAVSTTVLFQSCTEDIYQESVYTAEVFEVRADLTRDRGYSQTFNFSQPSHQGDNVLLYILWEQSDGQDIWRLVPQDVHLGNGDLVTYNFDFTRNDFRIFLDSNFNLNEMTDQEYSNIALNQIFRAVVVPGTIINGLISTPKVDYSDYEATIQYYGLQGKPVKKIN